MQEMGVNEWSIETIGVSVKKAVNFLSDSNADSKHYQVPWI